MGEYYPVLDEDGNIKFFANLGADFIYTLKDGKERLFYWRGGWAVEITDMASTGVIDLGEEAIIVDRLLDRTKNILAYTFSDVDEVVDFIAKAAGEKLEGRKILHSFSGGKDSIAALIVLLKLQERIRFDLHVVYSYMPYLESLTSLKFLDDVEKKLGIEIEILEPRRPAVLHSFNKYGMPMRGFRWCTYLKIRPIRDKMREIGADYEVKGDRYGESYKRFQSLLEYARRKMFLSGKQFRPVYFMTLLDVVKLTREADLVHPHYLMGCPRVACEYCPYRNLYEFELSSKDVEDLGFLEQMIRKTYEKYDVDEEIYWKLHLWRFHPNLAKAFAELWEKVSMQEQAFNLEEVSEMFSGIWKKPLPDARVLGVEDALKKIVELKEEGFGVI